MDFYTPEKDLPRDTKAGADDALPSVLLIGDSISCGYTGPVRELLRERWNVRRPDANCGDTKRGLESIDEWIGDRAWDLIHFNWGLHDLCYRHPDSKVYGNRDKEKGTLAVEPEQYRENLDTLVRRMARSAKKLVWANTTVVPPGEAGRFEGDEIRYNAIAAEVMAARGVPTNDLHTLTAAFDPSLFWQPCDVHFSEEGYRIIARQVARVIEEFRA
jgi:lysophospholipase L1-like esterase